MLFFSLENFSFSYKNDKCMENINKMKNKTAKEIFILQRLKLTMRSLLIILLTFLFCLSTNALLSKTQTLRFNQGGTVIVKQGKRGGKVIVRSGRSSHKGNVVVVKQGGRQRRGYQGSVVVVKGSGGRRGGKQTVIVKQGGGNRGFQSGWH
jgi:hypothetical protein